MPVTKRAKYSSEANGKLADLITLGDWKTGINNRKDIYNLSDDELHELLNADVTNEGKLRKRKGYTKILDGNFHSLYSFKNHVYFSKDNNFTRMDKNGNLENLLNNFSKNKIYYCVVNEELYFSDGQKTFKINKFNNIEFWSIETPESEIDIIVGAQGSGTFKKGRYLINCSYLFGKYETSVKLKDQIIEVPYDDFNLELSIQGSSTSTSCNFYVSSCNGEELFLIAENVPYTATIDFFMPYKKTPKKKSVGLYPLDKICYENGRIWGVIEDKIYFSNDLDYRQMNPLLYIPVDDTKIKIFKAISRGLYAVTEKATYFIEINGTPENPNNLRLDKILDISAYEDTLIEDEKKDLYIWLSDVGLVIGEDSGKIETPNNEKIDLPKDYEFGSGLLKENNGLRQYIFSMNDIGENTNLNSDDYK